MPSTAVPNPSLHHVNLKTVRLQEMIDWYGLVVGIEVTHQFEGGAWLSNDSANHRLALLCSPEMEDDSDKMRHTGLHHTAYEYPSMDRVRARWAAGPTPAGLCRGSVTLMATLCS